MRRAPPALLLLAAALWPASSAAQQKSLLDSRYESPTQCKDVERSPEDEDWVYVRCRGLGGIPVWYSCTDSARCKLGIGTKANVSGMFAAETFAQWPLEWRGKLRRGNFKPFALIIRGRSWDPDEPRTSLTVYRLRTDGTSCVIGEATTNDQARRIADGAAVNYRCSYEPELP